MIISTRTAKAIKLFRQIERKKRRVEQLKIKLESYAKNIPDDEMPVYLEQAERIKREQAAALERFTVRRLQIRARG